MTDEDIDLWLESGDIPLSKAMSVIIASPHVLYHPVSTLVNKNTNNSPECIQKIDLE